MSLLQLIKDDALLARKARDKVKSDTLILLIGECERIAKDATDEQVNSVGRKMIKNLQSVIELEMTSYVAVSQAQLDILEPYFPEKAIEPFTAVADRVRQENPDAPHGKLVGLVMKAGQGTYDINEVKAYLS